MSGLERSLRVGACALVLAALAAGCASEAQPALQEGPPVSTYRVVDTYPHDPQAFTQGLLFRDGFLYESTGRRGRSALRQVELETGRVVRERPIEARFFGEGLALWDDHLIQLTWQANIGFVYGLADFERQRTFSFGGEGWGLTAGPNRLILSDGSDRLRFLDPVTFEEQGSLAVTDGGRPVRDLNELEYVRGEIYANVWHTNRIARISPASGRVIGWIDLAGLLSPIYRLNDPEAVLNGIAFDSASNRLFVTGKLWPLVFEIELEPLTD